MIWIAAYILMSEPTEDVAMKKKPKQFWELDYKKAFAGLKEKVLNRILATICS